MNVPTLPKEPSTAPKRTKLNPAKRPAPQSAAKNDGQKKKQKKTPKKPKETPKRPQVSKKGAEKARKAKAAAKKTKKAGKSSVKRYSLMLLLNELLFLRMCYVCLTSELTSNLLLILRSNKGSGRGKK